MAQTPPVRLGLWKFAPAILGGLLILLLSLLLLFGKWIPGFQFVERLELISYDWRVRISLQSDGGGSDSFGVVQIDERTLSEINRRDGFEWPLPRMLYAQVLRELSVQGAQGVVFDIFFLDLDDPRSQPTLPLVKGGTITSDSFFAQTLGASPNAILTAPNDRTGRLALPASLFRSKARGLGHAVRTTDDDGVLRRIKPFVDDPDAGRVWHAGIVLASARMKLKLSEARVEPHRILIPTEAGGQVTLPLDHTGCMLVNWTMPVEDPRLRMRNMLSVLASAAHRGKGNDVPNTWKDRLVVIGSTGVGNNIADVGPTPLSRQTFLFSTIWNVANSLTTGQFAREPQQWMQVTLLAAFTALSGFVSWRLRAMFATGAVIGLAALYVALVVWIYLRFRLVLPMVLPVAGALLMTHATMVAFRMVLERGHRRKVRTLFQHLVSPNIMDLLIEHPDPSYGTQKREITVLFADIRGFTDYTDQQRTDAEKEIQHRSLSGAEADQCHDRHANEAMETVNMYLSAIVDAVKKHDGTLDKYIGDCVMAFWGAPMANPRHAEAAVLAAIDAQRAVAAINAEREKENECIAHENKSREERGEFPQPLLPLLTIGIGINSGIMTVGFMGSSRHLSNYTVFGREVNIASRLEGISGSSRIIVSMTTRELAEKQNESSGLCFTPLGDFTVKGIASPVATFEILWHILPKEIPCPNAAESFKISLN